MGSVTRHGGRFCWEILACLVGDLNRILSVISHTNGHGGLLLARAYAIGHERKILVILTGFFFLAYQVVAMVSIPFMQLDVILYSFLG